MKNIKIFNTIVFITLFCGLKGQTGEEISLRKISEASINYNSRHIKQKVYLQTDKDRYCQNEKIWIKAFVNSGPYLLPDTLSRNLYVELWSPSKIRVDIIRLKLNYGVGYGSLLLSDTLEQGVYQIRAFTDIMLNLPSEFYFNLNFEFYNSNHQYIISPKDARKNRKKIRDIENEKGNYQLFFVPEGGNIVSNRPAKIYYRAANSFGERINVNFKVVDPETNSIISTCSSVDGLGEFTYYPKSELKYRIEAIFGSGEKKEYQLPVAKNDGVWGSIEENGETIYLKLSKPFRQSDDPSANRYFVIMHANNLIREVFVTDLRSDTTFVFDKSKFQPGILNFSVISNRLQSVADYKIYLNSAALKEPEIRFLNANDSLIFTFDSNFVAGLWSASASIIEHDADTICLPDYINEKFLSSDIKGWFSTQAEETARSENYFQNLLVNTMPNSNPIWEVVFNTSKESNYIDGEDGIVIAGRILTDVFSIPVKNASVKLEILDRYNDIFEATTDNKGNFMFTGFDFYDTLQMKIIARKPSGRKGVIIEFRNDPVPGISEYNGNFFLTTLSLRDNKAYRREENIKASEEAHRKDREIEDFYKGVVHGRPDNILYGYELPQNMNVLEAIQGRVAGVDVTGGQVLIRGRNTIFGSTDPLVLVDDVPADVSILSTISVIDVDRIEIIKGPSSAIYGVRGGNGVIAVYTKRGEFMKRGEIDFTLVGYQKPEKFVQGASPDSNNNLHVPYTVLWVPELTDYFANTNLLKCKLPAEGKNISLVFFGITFEGAPVSKIITYKNEK